MSATAAMIARVRLLTNEPTNAGNYTDALVTAHIERYPTLDERGEKPYTFSTATPPARVENPNWMDTYDLFAAAADIWFQKAAAVADQFKFGSDDQSFDRNQVYEQYMKQARACLSRRKTTTMTQTPNEIVNEDVYYIINNPELP
jgi:hypothetical protein